MKHFLITRVAVGQNEEFLKTFDIRDRIFHEFTLPSVQSQTNKIFEWLLLFDSEFPNKDMMEEYKKYGTVLITNRGTSWVQTTIDYINSVAYNEDYIITTRMDSDDVISPQFIEKIQEHYKDHSAEQLLSLCTGSELDYNTGDIFKFEKKYSNPFISLREIPSEGIVTVNTKQHGQMEKEYITKYMFTIHPMRTRILHGYNAARKEVLKGLEKLPN